MVFSFTLKLFESYNVLLKSVKVLKLSETCKTPSVKLTTLNSGFHSKGTLLKSCNRLPDNI